MDQDVLVAIQWFPARQQAIEALAARDEDFRSICADLADAQAALRRWEESSSAVREQRCSEYQTLVEELAGEIVCALDAATVIPLNRQRPSSEGS